MKAAVVGGAIGAVSAAGLAYAVRAPRSSLLAPSVYRGVSDRRAIALTFDDGPSESTPRVLELLARYSAPATFFQCGMHVRRLPAVAREVVRNGHEIGNHTDTHAILSLRSRAFIRRELARAQTAIHAETGVRPVFFRAPYGVRWFGLGAVQHELGLTGVMWTTLGVDWKEPENQVAARLRRGAGNGAIFCLHDGRGVQSRPDIRVTLRSLEQVLPVLIDNGYHFERVSEILCPTA